MRERTERFYRNNLTVRADPLQCIPRLQSSFEVPQPCPGKWHIFTRLRLTITRPCSHLYNDEELLSRLSLRDDILTLLEGAWLQSVGNGESLPLIKRFYQVQVRAKITYSMSTRVQFVPVKAKKMSTHVPLVPATGTPETPTLMHYLT